MDRACLNNDKPNYIYHITKNMKHASFQSAWQVGIFSASKGGDCKDVWVLHIEMYYPTVTFKIKAYYIFATHFLRIYLFCVYLLKKLKVTISFNNQTLAMCCNVSTYRKELSKLIWEADWNKCLHFPHSVSHPLDHAIVTSIISDDESWLV